MITFAWSSMSVPVFQSLICCFNGSKFRCILSTPTLRRSFRSAAGVLVEDGREVAFEHVADRDLISDREGQPHRLVIGIAQADRESGRHHVRNRGPAHRTLGASPRQSGTRSWPIAVE